LPGTEKRSVRVFFSCDGQLHIDDCDNWSKHVSEY
jgi:ribosome maturation factor RimP